MVTIGPRTALEERIVAASAVGELVDLRTGDSDSDDPAYGESWSAARSLRAEILVDLITAAVESAAARPRAIKVRGARLTGALNLEACTLSCPLLLQNCYFEEPINMNEATAIAVRLEGSYVLGLTAKWLRTVGNLNLDDGFVANGLVDLLGAHIGGQLNFSGARLINHSGVALQADDLTVDQTVFFRDGFMADGELRLRGAHIGAQLNFRGAHLINPGGVALRAGRLHVDDDVLCRDGFVAEGEVSLSGAYIGGQFTLGGARLVNPGGNAMSAMRLTVGEDMFCRDGFTAEGAMFLYGAKIGGRLNLTAAVLSNPDGVALELGAATMAELVLLPAEVPTGAVSLTNARTISFGDDETTWPTTMYLRGFTYETLGNDNIGVRARLAWLTRHPGGYVPQLYDQLAQAYKRTGQEGAARRVGIAKQWRRRSSLNPLNWLLYLTVGYGYRTWLAGIWPMVLAGIGTPVFSHAFADHLFQANPHAPAFHPVAYTLDILLPIVDLGQEKAWIPQGFAVYWAWGLIAVGWILTTAVVAGLTGILRRD
jgi:hypothetical protein